MKMTKILWGVGALCFGAFSLQAQVEPGNLLWKYTLPYDPTNADARVQASAALGPEGTIYLTTDSAVIALSNTPSGPIKKWSFPVGIGSTTPVIEGGSSPAIAPDGTVYICSSDGSLYAIDSGGSQKWSFPLNGFESSPAIGADGTVYVVGESYVFAVTPIGSLKWKTQIAASRPYKSPILSGDATVYVGTAGAHFYALGPDGGIKWVRELQSEAGDSAAIGADGSIYVSGGQLYAFTPDGAVLWATGNFTGALPAVSVNGMIYARESIDRKLFALSSDGRPSWNTLPDSDPSSLATTPIISADGTLYYAASNSLWALSPTGDVRWHFDSGYTFPGSYLAQYSPVLAPDGTLYAVFGQTLYAIMGNTTGPAVQPWSMYRGNAQHTGRSQHPSLHYLQQRPDGNVEFQVISQVGVPLTIEKSTDFRTWTSMTNLVPISLPEKVVDLTATNSPMRFYRAVGGG